MPGTAAGAAKRKRCPQCGAFAHEGACPQTGRKPEDLLALIETGRVVEPSGCHSLRGLHGRAPTVGGPGRKELVRRVLLGLVPGDGLVARHTCDVEWCINPDHLIVGTQDDNMGDMVERERSNRDEKHWNWQGGIAKRPGQNRRR